MALLSSLACERILEVKPISQITNQVYWQNEDDFSAYLTGIYQLYRTQMNDLSFGDDRSESYVQGSLPRFSAYWSQVINAGNAKDWTSYYSVIGHVNFLLAQMDGFTFSNQTNKNRIRAEALTLSLIHI